jgi:Dual-action HEIGH metallo-peptidase
VTERAQFPAPDRRPITLRAEKERQHKRQRELTEGGIPPSAHFGHCHGGKSLESQTLLISRSARVARSISDFLEVEAGLSNAKLKTKLYSLPNYSLHQFFAGAFMSRLHPRGLLLVALSAAAVACSTDRGTGPATNNLASRVIALGFSSKGMEDHGGYVVVEGDIRLDKGALLNSSSSKQPNGKEPPRTPNYQYSTDVTVSQTYVEHITVDLSNIASVSDWANAARNAMTDYSSSSGSAVRMIEQSPGDITFSSVGTLGDGVVSQASFPYQGSPSRKPGPTVTVSQAFNSYSLNQKEKVLVHELGHTIGLRHDNAPNVDPPSSIGANLISGTPTSDPNSVMIFNVGGTSWTGFSSYDLIALNALYPTIIVNVTGPATVAANRNCTWNGSASGGIPPYTYAWQVQPPASGTFYPVFGSNTSFTTNTGSSYSGAVYVTLQVTDAIGLSVGKGVQAYDTGFGGSYDHTYCA